MSLEQLLADMDAMQKEGTMVKSLTASAPVSASAPEGNQEKVKVTEQDLSTTDGKMIKSYKFQMSNGEDVLAIDGSAMIKSVSNEMTILRDQSSTAFEKMFELIKSQQMVIGELSKRVENIGQQGAGRKAVVTVNDKVGAPNMVKSMTAQSGMSRTEFFAKALELQAANKLSGAEIAYADTALKMGEKIPETTLRKVFAAA